MAPAVAVALALFAAAPAGEAPSPQTLVFYNARLALREGKPSEALKLWLLRNSLASRGHVGRHDEEFRSVVWEALGELGLCQDGFPLDDRGGAGLWPLSLHNWVVHALNKGPPPKMPPPYDAFDVGRQQRFVSLHDVLASAELRSVTFFRTPCLYPNAALYTELGEVPWFDASDRLTAGRLMRSYLVSALGTLRRQKLRSTAPIEARIFDLDLALANLQARKSRREGAAAAQRARAVGVSEAGAKELKAQVATWPEGSEQAAFLRRCLTWPARDWLALSPSRRLFLFSQAKPFATDPAATERLVVDIIDALIDQKAGGEVEAWIGHLEAKSSPPRRAALFGGDRGRRLLELDAGTGFRERALVALHRGVAFLEAGEQAEALRSFAYAMAQADSSREPAVTMALARRWLSFVLARYQTDEEVIATLQALVPRQEYNAVVEDLLWRAAVRADEASFERLVATTRHGGALDAKAARLRMLAQGKTGALATDLRQAAVDEPFFTLRFARQLLEQLESEEASVREAHVPTVKLLLYVLDVSAGSAGANKAQVRTAEELSGRCMAILKGLRQLESSVSGRARALSPRHEAFAGAIRLAPADELPWPFVLPEAEAPSAFTVLALRPVEWRDEQGALVFGWSVIE